jgi:hypothetical protein
MSKIKEGNVLSKKRNLSVFTIVMMVVLTVGVTLGTVVPGYAQYAGGKIDITIPMKIPASEIGLPTTGATIKTVTLVSALEKNNRNGEYYKVLGAIHPVDQTAPDINFQVNLPTKWNHKIVQYGGGGFNGILITAEGPIVGQNATDPTPLARGYATFGSDSGHVATKAWDSDFGLNDEALHNFAVDQLKKTKDVAMILVQSFYNSKPSQVYFAGGSEGGREALIVVQRFPKDYDGVICLYPALNWVPEALAFTRNADAVQVNNGAGWISPEKYKLVSKTVMKICDGLDGVEDGIISNIAAAEKKREEILTALSSDFSEEQLRTLKTFASPMKFSFLLANGLTIMPGYKVFQGTPLVDRFRNQYGTSPTARDGLTVLGDAIIKYQVIRDKDFNPVNFNPEQWKDQIVKASELLDATNPDITPFKENGGKLILLHGIADQFVTVQGTVDYYNRLVGKYGQNRLDKFVKFYLVPGYGHVKGEIFTMGTDLLGPLDDWVVNKKVPENLVVTDQNDETAGRTRPLCEYPTYPRYKGSGNVNSAESFIKVAP